MNDRLYHGGVAGLRAGELLLPPAETGWKPPRLDAAVRFNGQSPREYLGPDLNRGDRVYLTTDRELARGYAGYRALADGMFGALYIAEPEGETETDPDLPEVSVQCARARITRVYDPVVRLSRAQTARRLSRHVTSDGPMYVIGEHGIRSIP